MNSHKNKPYYQAEDDFCVYYDVCDNMPNSHGTEQLMTIAAMANNGQGIAGVAPQAQMIPVKIGHQSSISDLDVEQALEQLNSNFNQGQTFDVVNMSFARNLGYFELYGLKLSQESTWKPTLNHIKELNRKGVVIVASAGNNGSM